MTLITCRPFFASLRRSLLILPAMALLLTGCAGNQPLHQADIAYMDQHTQRLSQLTHWQIQGKIRLKTADSSDSANLQWQQNGGFYRLTLSGPLGRVGAQLEGTPYQVMLTIPDKGHYTDSTPEQLLLNHFGWDLPVSSLTYWVRTLPAPGSGYQSELNPARQVARLQQDGWDIAYDRYRTVSHNHQQSTELPGRMKVRKGELELTFIINDWQLPEHQTSLLQ